MKHESKLNERNNKNVTNITHSHDILKAWASVRWNFCISRWQNALNELKLSLCFYELHFFVHGSDSHGNRMEARRIFLNFHKLWQRQEQREKYFSWHVSMESFNQWFPMMCKYSVLGPRVEKQTLDTMENVSGLMGILEWRDGLHCSCFYSRHNDIFMQW